jgi:hypothetical protein
MTVQYNLFRDRELTASITPIRLRSKVVPHQHLFRLALGGMLLVTMHGAYFQ